MKTLWLVLAAATLIVQEARGDLTLFDAGGFEGYAVGELVGQNGWASLNGFTDVFRVQNAGVGGSRGVAVASGRPDSVFPPINYTPTVGSGEIIRIEADIARTLGTTSSPSFVFAVDVYQEGSRITRFGLQHSGGTIVPFVTSRTRTNGEFFAGGNSANVAVGGSLPANVFQSFRADLNFDSKSLNLFVNEVSVTGSSSIPFVFQGAFAISDADLQVSTTSGADDVGFFDNYRVRSIAVPEPASSILAMIPLAAIAFRRRLRWSVQMFGRTGKTRFMEPD